MEAARRSPVWKMAMEWKVAFPLHPEYRTLPMVWYVPPLSPIQSAAEAGQDRHRRRDAGRAFAAHSAAYLANLLTAGEEEPVARAGADAGDARLHAGQDRRRVSSTRPSPQSGSA
jgi:nitrate reductase beta subunit